MAECIVWRLTDGRRGHENQTAGLLAALAERTPLTVHDIPAPPPGRALLQWLMGRFPPGEGLPAPELIVAAGHRSHPALLAARRARGGRAVVLMRPSLPLGWFDLCVIPEHDAPPARDHVFISRGTLNPVRAGEKRGGEGVILLGGPSRHHQWDGEAVAWRIAQLMAAEPARRWTVADSRRTPEGFLDTLAALPAERVGWREVGPGWLAERLASTPLAWVSEDSVNMVYEALTAGAAVGVLPLPRKGSGRVSRGLDRLLAEGVVVDFDGWRDGREPAAPSPPFNEAARCARWIEERWLSEN